MPRSGRRVRERDTWIERLAWSLIRPIWGFALGYFLFMGQNITWFPLGVSKNPDYSPFVVAFLLSMLLLVVVFFVLKSQSATGKALSQIREMKPDVFEDWVAVRFRGLGYSVRVSGRSGDHGVDLEAEKDGELTVVQCKRFRSWSVGERDLRDLYGAMHDFGAERAILVTTGRVTQAARSWIEGKPIEIWDSEEVARLSKKAAASVHSKSSVVSASSLTTALARGVDKIATHALSGSELFHQAVKCPRCGSDMMVRKNRNSGELFLGCPRFPSCRYTQPLAKARD